MRIRPLWGGCVRTAPLLAAVAATETGGHKNNLFFWSRPGAGPMAQKDRRAAAIFYLPDFGRKKGKMHKLSKRLLNGFNEILGRVLTFIW